MVTHSERTHLLGLVPPAWAFRAQGDDVLVAVQPALASRAEAAGLPVVAVGRDNAFWRVARAQGLDRPTPALGVAAGSDFELLHADLRRVVPWWWQLINDPMVDDLVHLCRRWRPDLVLWGAVTFAGGLAAAACGARHARVLFGVDLAGDLYTRFLRARPVGRTEDPLLAWLARRGAPHGVHVDQGVVQGESTVDYMPPSLRVPVGASPVRSVRYVPFNGRALLPPWLRPAPRRPRVAVTLGQSIFERTQGGLAHEELLAAVAELDVEVIALVPTHLHATLRPQPPQVRVEGFVPLDALAASCDVVVNHGGAGTLLTAARHAVPQLVIPATYDEPMLGTALERRGAGLTLDPAADRAAVAEAVGRLLSEQHFRNGARALQAEIADMPTPAALAESLRVG